MMVFFRGGGVGLLFTEILFNGVNVSFNITIIHILFLQTHFMTYTKLKRLSILSTYSPYKMFLLQHLAVSLLHQLSSKNNILI